ncbi:MAG TPA: hypothetical protein VLM18_05020, partial [Croceibacterium sp.]|nr:hypothetical protein [Croceibacterium sp.]
DEEGEVLPDLEAARARAISNARAMIAAEILDKGEFNLSHRVEVEDENGKVVLIVKFGDAVKIGA